MNLYVLDTTYYVTQSLNYTLLVYIVRYNTAPILTLYFDF